MTNNPWEGLEAPSLADTLTARRVDAETPWRFYWARSIDQRCLLILRHAPDPTLRVRLPNLKGLDVSITDGGQLGDRVLVLSLLEPDNIDIFHRLCNDIVSAASSAPCERDAVMLAAARTWRWHHLLRGGDDGRLSLEEQMGLIGELCVIERHLLHQMSAPDAISCWHGPMGAPKDFEIGRLCIEAKAHRGNAPLSIPVSSELQLDDTGLDALFLHVLELDLAAPEHVLGYTLTDFVTRIRDTISDPTNEAGARLETLLTCVGFSFEDDYSDTRWIDGPVHVYRVCSGFPRLTGTSVVPGVSELRYRVSLAACEPYRVTPESMRDAIGDHYGNGA